MMPPRVVPEFLARDRARDRWGEPLYPRPYAPALVRPTERIAAEHARWIEELPVRRDWSGPHYSRPDLTVREVGERIVALGPDATPEAIRAIDPEYYATKCDACCAIDRVLIQVKGTNDTVACLCLPCVTAVMEGA